MEVEGGRRGQEGGTEGTLQRASAGFMFFVSPRATAYGEMYGEWMGPSMVCHGTNGLWTPVRYDGQWTLARYCYWPTGLLGHWPQWKLPTPSTEDYSVEGWLYYL